MEQILDKTHPKYKKWYEKPYSYKWDTIKDLKASLKKGSDAVKKPPWIEWGEWWSLIDKSLVDIKTAVEIVEIEKEIYVN